MSNVVKLNSKTHKKFSVKVKDIFDESNHDRNQNQFEVKLKQQYESGLNDGYKNAKSEFEKLYNDKLTKKIEEFNLILKSVDEKMLGYEKEFDTLVIQFAFEIAGKIARREITIDSGIENTLKDSLRKVLGANNIIVKLHPNDHKRIIGNSGKSSFVDDTISKIKFEEDDRIEIGGCVVETEIGNVDARVMTRFSELRKYFEPSNDN